jgi:hypothetical protein
MDAKQSVRQAVEGAEHMAPLGRPNKVSMRLRISAAALLVKVTAKMLFGEAPST